MGANPPVLRPRLAAAVEFNPVATAGVDPEGPLHFLLQGVSSRRELCGVFAHGPPACPCGAFPVGSVNAGRLTSDPLRIAGIGFTVPDFTPRFGTIGVLDSATGV